PQLDSLLGALAAHDGSDLHVKGEAIPRIRVDGDLRRLQADPLSPSTVSEMAAAIMRPDMADHFERRNEADFAYMLDGVGRFRVNAFRQRGSVAMIFRRVRSSAATIEDLGLPVVLARLANEPRGLVLVTGPTGSGKTTTLAAMIDHINTTREVHVVTIEDPIEVLHSDKLASIEQREIGVDTADFGTAMRGAMRQDPDVILVGEMRDEETVAAALSAAETGHLVLSTLHTIDATETVNRIVDFFPPHKQKQVRIALAGALKGIVCQRLVPRADKTGRAAARRSSLRRREHDDTLVVGDPQRSAGPAGDALLAIARRVPERRDPATRIGAEHPGLLVDTPDVAVWPRRNGGGPR